MKNILFLCTGNACRSQMAEGWARHLRFDDFHAHSAGVAPHGVDPRAVRVMAEAGVDISGHRSKYVDEFLDIPLDLVVTVCDTIRSRTRRRWRAMPPTKKQRSLITAAFATRSVRSSRRFSCELP